MTPESDLEIFEEKKNREDGRVYHQMIILWNLKFDSKDVKISLDALKFKFSPLALSHFSPIKSRTLLLHFSFRHA